MKVSIITILDNTNFGTYLQALATAKTINELNCEAEIIQYTRPCMTFLGRWKAILQDKGILRWVNRCIIHFSAKSTRLKKIDIDFLKSNAQVTKEYIGFTQLSNNPPVADIYLTGSDQVWNSFYNRGIDLSFYLDFAPQGKKRVSYAASIGMPEFPIEECDKVKDLLLKYSAITVREISAKTILSQMGIQSNVVLDPTLLLSKEAWKEIAQKYPFESHPPYLLTYSVEYGNEDQYIKYYAQKIAKEKGLKLYHITYGSCPKLNYYDKVYTYATPDLFLNLMLYASFVIVSSFHGTAFSINFNKQFITVSPKKFNSRIDSLLTITGLNNRIVYDKTRDVESFTTIDYDKINKIIDIERQKSITSLSQMLKIE